MQQKNSVTIGDEDYDLDSEHDSLPDLREQPSTEYTTSGGTTTPLRVEISSPSKQRRSGVFVPSISLKDDEQVVSTLSLTNVCVAPRTCTTERDQCCRHHLIGSDALLQPQMVEKHRCWIFLKADCMVARNLIPHNWSTRSFLSRFVMRMFSCAI